MPSGQPKNFLRRLRDAFAARRRLRSVTLAALLVGGAIWSHACVSGEGAYGPYSVIGYNYTDRHIVNFFINGFAGGASEAHKAGGGGGIVCCFSIPKNEKNLHVKVELEWTQAQYLANAPHDTFETDVPVPPLKNKHDGFIEFHFLPNRRVEAAWVNFPTTPNIPGTH
ncbi:DUF3304 domain-containing protein [Paraburkholderia bannensis]|uniref:DUF3304 domain-containing protein n=1 Tax=Paraburkholderia bannensis TaxID=765414 RepID=UPI002AB69C32|nr:DUF3304 domain-containing protein [Paraburkholderia bannensis]